MTPAELPAVKLHPSRVRGNREIAPGVYLLEIPRYGEFLPGQIVAIRDIPSIAPRLYSIASGKDEPSVSLLYDIVPGGELTPRLSRMVAGDSIEVSEPFGSFVDDEGPSWWIATGTGVAPFVSMAKSGPTAGKRLIHGGRSGDRFYYRELFSESLAGRYTCCCSQEAPPWAYAGRLTAWLAAQTDLPREARYMLCGGSGMVVEVRDILIAKGVPYDRIVSEIYF